MKNLSALLLLFVLSWPAWSLQITITNGDGAGEGLNDNTAASPIGGNTGTTLGQQRMVALQHAVDIWSSTLESGVPVQVMVTFDGLTCTVDEVILGQGEPVSWSRNFSGAPQQFVWYPLALANALADQDLNPSLNDITLVFNSSLDEGCQDGASFYYGLDGQPPAGSVDFVTIALRELARGLGFVSPVSVSTGGELSGGDDVFSQFVYDETAGKTWATMSNGERLTSFANAGNLTWNGAQAVSAAAKQLSAGLHPTSNRPLLAPPVEVDLNLAFVDWDASLTPDQILEPDYVGAVHDVGIAAEAMFDMGWQPRQNADLSVGLSVNDLNPDPGDTVQIQVQLNNGGPGFGSGIVVDVRLSKGLVYQSHSGGTFNDSTQEWNVTALADGASTTLTISALVESSSEVQVVAEVMASSTGDSDSIPGNGLESEDDFARLIFAGVATLANNQLVNNLAAPVAGWNFFRLNVPAGQQTLTVSTFGGIGDLDLYIRQGAAPDTANYDFRPLQLGNWETIHIENPTAGEWFIGTYGFRAFEDANLHVNFQASDLRLTIEDILIAGCPNLIVNAQVSDGNGPVTGLVRADFGVNEGQGNLAVTSVSETSAGSYEIRYQTQIRTGADLFPFVSVSDGARSTGAYSVYHNCTPKGAAIDVWAPNDIQTTTDVTIVVPIKVEPINQAFAVNSFEFDLSYDFSMLEYRGAIFGNTLVEDWNQVVVNGAVGGKVFVAGANTTQLNLQADTDDVLMALLFYVRDGLPAETCSDLVFDRFVFNNGTPIANTRDGLVCIPSGTGTQLTADLRLSKNLLGDPDYVPTVGELVEMRLRVTNDGPDYTYDVEVTDILPPSMELVSASGNYDVETGIWYAGFIFPSQTAFLDLTVRTLASGDLTNTAEITKSKFVDPDSTPNNGDPEEDDIASLTFPVNPIPPADLSLAMSVDNATPLYRDNVVVSFMLTNDGPAEVTTAYVTSRLEEITPRPASYVSHSGEGSYNTETGQWAVSNLGVGETVQLDVTYRMDGATEVTFVGEVTLSSNPDPDSTPDNQVPEEDDQASVSVDTIYADFAMTGTASESILYQDQTVVVTFTLTHERGEPATPTAHVVLNPEYLTATLLSGTNYDPATSIVWEPGEMEAGESVTLELETTFEGFRNLQWYATVVESTLPDPDSIPGPTVNVRSDDTHREEIPAALSDMELTASSSNLTPAVGEEFTVTLNLFNDGPWDNRNLVTAVTLPSNFEYVTVPGDFDQGTGLWTVASQAADVTNSLNLTVRKTATGAGELVFELIAADAWDEDSTPNNNLPSEDDQTSLFLGSSDFALDLQVDNPEPVLEELLTFTLAVTNNGPDPTQNYTVLMNIPAGLRLINVPTTYDPQTRVLSNTDPIGIGETQNFEFQLQVTNGSVKVVSADLATAELPDPNSTPGNNNPTEDDYAEVALLPECSTGATITIVNMDGPGEGFNDNTPAAPVGGNTGTTLGQQRLIAFRFAADIWASLLASPVEILIEARFDEQFCSPTSAVLGSAGPITVARDFPGAPQPNTFYPAALANALSGADQNASKADVRATFNSGLDRDNCLGTRGWYYGLDRNPGNNNDFVAVLLHELGHGLGFISLVSPNGDLFMGRNDIFSLYLARSGDEKTWGQMSSGERASSARSGNGLVWVGENLTSSSDDISVGVDGNGRVQLYAPGSYNSGSSVSHFNTNLSPNELMEPFYTGPSHDIGHAYELFRDLGWGCRPDEIPTADLALSVQVDNDEPVVSDEVTFTLAITNDGPDDSTGAEVLVSLSEGLTYTTHTVDGTFDEATGIWLPGEMMAGDIAYLEVSATVDVNQLQTFGAELISALQDDPDSVPENHVLSEDDQVEISVLPRGAFYADLSLTMTVDETLPSPGDTVVITLRVRNDGPDETTGVEVTDNLPSGVSFLSADGAYDSGSGVWSVGTLASGDVATLNISAEVTRTGPISNRAEVTASDLEDPDSTPGNAISQEDDDAAVELYGQPTFPQCSQCVEFNFNYTDEPDTGFNDPRVVEPTGGNPGTTLGEQRRFALEHAAHIMCAYIQSNVAVSVDVNFEDLACVAGEVIFGTAEANNWLRDFENAPLDDTWYPIALANSLAGTDLTPNDPEMKLTFNNRVEEVSGLNTGSQGSGQQCEAETVTYQTEHRSGGRAIKFENAPVGLGEDRTYMADTFVIEVEDGSESVEVKLKAARQQEWVTLTYVGQNILVGSMGFKVTLREIVGNLYVISVFATCNYHALSHVEFNFGSGASVVSPSDGQPYTADRIICPDLWHPDCEEEPEEPVACLPTSQWYYGVDGNAGDNIDFVTVALEQIIRGLGFDTLVDLDPDSPTFGAKQDGFNDAYMLHLWDGTSGKAWNQMNNSERAASASNVERLYWTGDAVSAGSSLLSAGVDDGLVRMNATATVDTTFTAKHFSPSCQPALLLQPGYGGVNHYPWLAVRLLQDIGWRPQGCADLSLEMTVDNPTPSEGDRVTFTVTVTNNGSLGASGIEVTSILGGGLLYASHTGDGSFDAGSGVWTIGTLMVGQSVDLDLSVDLVSGAKTHVVEITAVNEPDPDSIPDNRNPAEDDYARADLGTADLSLSWNTANNEPFVNEATTVSLTLFNDGPDAVSEVVIQLNWDAGINVVGASDTVFYNPSTQVWRVSNVPSGENVTINFLVVPLVPSTLTSFAEVVAADQMDIDSTPGNGILGEDDDATLDLNAQRNLGTLTVTSLGLHLSACPEMMLLVEAKRNDDAISGLMASNFTLLENNQAVTITQVNQREDGRYELFYDSVANGNLVGLQLTLEHTGDTASTFAVGVTCNSTGCTQLENNVRYGPTAALESTFRCYYIDVPANQRLLEVDTSFEAFGNADVYVRFGQPPTLNRFDYRSTQAISDELVSIEYPAGGRWYIGVHAAGEYRDVFVRASYYSGALDLTIEDVFTANCPEITARVAIQLDDHPVDWLRSSDFQLFEDGQQKVFNFATTDRDGVYDLTFQTLTPDGGTHFLQVLASVLGDPVSGEVNYSNCVSDCAALQNNVVVPNLAGLAGSFRCYYLDVPEGQDRLRFRSFFGSGDTDLFVRFGEPATVEVFDYRSNLVGTDDDLVIANPTAGRWYVGMQALADYRQTNLVGHYWTLDLDLTIEDLNVVNCPSVLAVLRVDSSTGPVSGLGVGNFALQEDGGEPVQLSSAVETDEPGVYEVTYLTDKTLGQTVQVTATVTVGTNSASDNDQFARCFPNGGALLVWINDELASPAGATIDIPVFIGPVSRFYNVSSFQFEIQYDPTILNFTDVSLQGTIAETWDFIDDSETTPGRIRVQVGNTLQAVLDSTGEENVLLYLQFTVDDFAAVDQCSPLAFERTYSRFNQGTPPSQLIDGRFCVSSGCFAAIGDVDRDGNAGEAFDALQVTRHVTAIPTVYDPIPICVADTNCSGAVTLFDSILILQRAARIINGYCESDQNRGVVDNFTINIPSEALFAEQEHVVEIPIELTGLPIAPAYGYTLEILFDPEYVNLYGEINSEGTLTERWGAPVVNTATPGRLVMSHFNPLTPLSSEGVLVKLLAETRNQGGTTVLNFTSFALAADTEPSIVPGPFNLEIDTGLCYDAAGYSTLRSEWAGETGVTVLDLLQFTACTAE